MVCYAYPAWQIIVLMLSIRWETGLIMFDGALRVAISLAALTAAQARIGLDGAGDEVLRRADGVGECGAFG